MDWKLRDTRALYTDWKNVYQRRAAPAEQLRGEVPVTQFGGMCQRLGIRIIAAGSPQAKGRVERMNGVHQDRLIKKMRRKGIGSNEAANAYLEKRIPAGAGAGLGLTIAHWIAVHHGGSIEVVSRPGEGTIFRIELCLTAAPVRNPLLA